jgi:putative protease
MNQRLEHIGRVVAYYRKLCVASVQLQASLRVGETVHIKGQTTDLTLRAVSLEVSHRPVERAHSAQRVGIKVSDGCRRNDLVFKIVDGPPQ